METQVENYFANFGEDALKKIGFLDQTGGWGGSTGCDPIYRLERDELSIEITCLYIINEKGFRWCLNKDRNIIFQDIKDIDSYCLKNFNKSIYGSTNK